MKELNARLEALINQLDQATTNAKRDEITAKIAALLDVMNV